MIALIPLDDRPCNRRFPTELGHIAGTEVLVPPREALGRFNQAGDPVALAQWLEGLPEVEALIVSIDMLAYGGLVASRRTLTSTEQALTQLQVLKTWRSNRPDTRLYAFNVLMRLAITMDSDAAIPHYYNVMRWARLCDEAIRFGGDYLNSQLQTVEAEIPPHILTEYKAARARNHAVNMTMVEWLGDGIFDYLLVTQEDCTEYGLHRLEQQKLQSQVAQLGVGAAFTLHPGADEAALTLLARHWQTGVRLRLTPSCAQDMKRIAPFEDIPYEAALASHIQALSGQVVTETPDVELFVNAPVGGSQKDETPETRAKRKAKVVAFVEQLEAALGGGRPVALCDVAFPNGADELLLRELEKRGLLGKLAAFAGWNTAGNTTGTVLAQAAALQHAAALRGMALAEVAAAPENRQFLFERLLDDWCYQSLVRARLDKAARERGLSPLSMNGGAGPIEAMARLEISNMAHMLAARQFEVKLERIDVELPWSRTFEVEVGARLA